MAPPRRDYAYQFVSFLALAIAVLCLAVLAFGATIIPPFPFQNTQQLGVGIPEWEAQGSPDIGMCEGKRLLLFQFKRVGGTDGWQVWVSVEGEDLTAGYWMELIGPPQVVYFGTSNPANGHITISRSELFNSETHKTPCQGWK